MELRHEDIAEIVRIFNESELQELRLDLGGNRLYLSKQVVGSPGWEPVGPETSAGVSPAPPTLASSTAAAPASGASAALADAPSALPAAAASPSPRESQAGSAEMTEPGVSPVAAPPSATSDRSGLVELTSPLLGVFYRRPAPDKPPFVEIGSEVDPEDPVCIIDVMKMFSRVPAGVAGRVVAILAEDGQLVEHGQVLMHLEPR
jgi:acetyl-CoA carboxylase biotin carboxyl carrier protein